MTQTNFSEFDPGTVFLYYHDYVWAPFLVIGRIDLDIWSTYYINRGRVLKRKWESQELLDQETVKVIGSIDLTEAILDILERRGRDAYRLLDILFDYVKSQQRFDEVMEELNG